MSDETTKNELIEITGLWASKTSDGEKFLSGSLGRARILIFKNGFKTSDKHPDYRMYITKRRKQEDENAAPAVRNDGEPGASPSPRDSDTDTPF